MNIRQLSPTFCVAGQITADHLPLLAEHGFRTIVNNRPDGEAAGQPQSADLASVAAALGMKFIYLPVRSGPIAEEDVEKFASVCHNLDTPVLLFCRSGARSTILWQRSEAGRAREIPQ